MLREKTPDVKLKTLIKYLPLLKTNGANLAKLRDSYFELMSDLFINASNININLSDCYQLAHLAFLHPIFDRSQKSVIRSVLETFEQVLAIRNNTNNNIISSNNNNSSTSVISSYSKFEDAVFAPSMSSHEIYSELSYNRINTNNFCFSLNEPESTLGSSFITLAKNTSDNGANNNSSNISNINSSLNNQYGVKLRDPISTNNPFLIPCPFNQLNDSSCFDNSRRCEYFILPI